MRKSRHQRCDPTGISPTVKLNSLLRYSFTFVRKVNIVIGLIVQVKVSTKGNTKCRKSSFCEALQLEHRVLRYQVEMQAVQQYQGTQGSSSAVSEAKLLRQPRKSLHQVEVEGQSVSSMLCVELRKPRLGTTHLAQGCGLKPSGLSNGIAYRYFGSCA